MKLKRLKIQNFKSFKEAEINFPDKGLVLLNGRDLQTGESSGTGKSNVLLAIAYALDILPTGTTVSSLQSFLSDSKLQVELEFDDGSLIRRGKETSFTTKGVKVSGAKATEEALKAYFGVEPAVLRALCFRSQSRPASFLTLDPSSKIKFLTSVLQLDRIVDAIEESKASIAKLEAEKTSLERFVKPVQFVQIEFELDELNTKINHLTLDKSEVEIIDLSAEIAKAKSLLAAQIQKQEEARTQHYRQVLDFQSRINEKKGVLTGLLGRLRSAVEMDQKLQSFKASKCPTCGTAGHRPDLIAATETQIQELGLNVGQITTQIQDVKTEISILEEERAGLDANKPPANVAVTKLQSIVEGLQAKESEGKLKVKEIEIQITRLQAEVARLKEFSRRQTEENNRQIELSNAIKDLEGKIQQEKDFILLLGKDGFLSSIMADVLTEIANEANGILRRLSNVNSVTISFTTENESANKKKIETWVDVRGVKTSIEDGCSGGMTTSINQAVDLALIRVLSRRFGTNPQWLCLDEIFNGQGAITKESALEILQETASDNLVIVVDHGTEFKEFFNEIIEISFDNGESKIGN